MHTIKTYCPLPWKHAMVRMNGTIALCCSYSSSTPYNLKDTPITEYWNSDYLKQVRNDMFDGIERDECQSCYDREQLGMVSRRQDSIDKWGLATIEPSPIDVEFHISNLCNAKCLICRPKDSSTYEAENKLMGVPLRNDIRYDANVPISEERLIETLDTLFDNNLQTIDLRGGESMMIPTSRDLLLSMDENRTKNVTLKIQSNGTKFDDTWETIFKKFKHVELMLSIDAFDEDNFYFRYPCNWNDINLCINRVQSMNNVEWFINTTIGNLNLFTLPKLFDWINENNYTVHLSTIDLPEMFKVTNLPVELSLQVVEQLTPFLDTFKLEKTNENLKALIAQLNKNKGPKRWNEFCEYIRARDAFRKNSIFDVVPAMEEHFA